MQNNIYTPEQTKDIEERVAKAAKVLEELQLGLFANTQSVAVGQNVFAMQVTPFLGDLKFQEAPTQKEKVDQLLKGLPKFKK